jgi:hypothetical protein
VAVTDSMLVCSASGGPDGLGNARILADTIAKVSVLKLHLRVCSGSLERMSWFDVDALTSPQGEAYRPLLQVIAPN